MSDQNLSKVQENAVHADIKDELAHTKKIVQDLSNKILPEIKKCRENLNDFLTIFYDEKNAGTWYQLYDANIGKAIKAQPQSNWHVIKRADLWLKAKLLKRRKKAAYSALQAEGQKLFQKLLYVYYHAQKIHFYLDEQMEITEEEQAIQDTEESEEKREEETEEHAEKELEDQEEIQEAMKG